MTTLLILYFLAIVVLSKMKTVYFKGKAIYFFRAFFPSWKFFEDLGEVPSLDYRISRGGQDFGPWTPVLEKASRSPGALILNAKGNYLIAAGSLLQQLVTDLEDEPKEEDLKRSVSYRLIQNLVRFQIKELGVRYQFKVSVTFEDRIEDVLISPAYELAR